MFYVMFHVMFYCMFYVTFLLNENSHILQMHSFALLSLNMNFEFVML